MEKRNHSLIKQVIYVSKPIGFDDKTLDRILAKSAINNEKNNITGALICRSDLYLQFLEGPAHKIDDVYSRIKVDTRHRSKTFRGYKIQKTFVFQLGHER